MTDTENKLQISAYKLETVTSKYEPKISKKHKERNGFKRKRSSEK
jgi:hypothetical protein